MPKPLAIPKNLCFASGPCAKRPGWRLEKLENALLGRSHRSVLALTRIKELLQRTRSLLGLPEDYQIALTPGSATGAIEMAMWSMLGARGIDVLAWDVFGHRWVDDIINQLKIQDVRVFCAKFGQLPNLKQVDCNRDVVFTWNGTSTGVHIPNADWINPARQGLTFCDAVSAVFTEDLPWSQLDVTTFSWQKSLGGEAGIGAIVLSPRAIEHLKTYTPPWPIPGLFRFKKEDKILEGFFQGNTLNTPSLLCIEDFIDALKWAEDIGGLVELRARLQRNFTVVDAWVAHTPWIDFLSESPYIQSKTPVCLKIIDPKILSLDISEQWHVIKLISNFLEHEGIAYDIKNHGMAPPSLRLWLGPTIETDDVKALLPWIEWAYETIKKSL
jgi:phosphoserine aminotransferase